MRRKGGALALPVRYKGGQPGPPGNEQGAAACGVHRAPPFRRQRGPGPEMKILLVCVWGGTQEQKEQAKRLSQAAGQIPTPPPVFEAIKEIGTVVPTVKLQDLASSHLDSPFVLEADSVKTALEQWLGDKNTQAVIASWAAKYKKTTFF